MTAPFMFNFRSLSNKVPPILFDFSHFTPRLGYFSQEKLRKLKIIGFKNMMERGNQIIFTFVMRQISSKIFGKIILNPLQSKNFVKNYVPPG